MEVATQKENINLQRTTFPSLLSIKRQWYFLDLKNRIVGREAAEKIANLLRGKNRNDFTPNLDLGNYVVLVNARHITFTGNDKLGKEKYWNHSGYPGGLRERTLREMLEKYPEELVFRIIRGMMPHTKLGNKQVGRLFIFAEEEMINKNKKKILQAQAKNFIKISLSPIRK
jgi:large subunit ribosomal protein L13